MAFCLRFATSLTKHVVQVTGELSVMHLRDKRKPRNKEPIMNSLTLNKPWSRTSAWARALTLAALAAGAWALSSTQAQASDVHFSVGVHAPGVSLGVSSHPPVYYSRPPVYYSPPPVYYSPPPVYYSPPPVYYAPPPVYHRGVRPVVVVPPPIYYERPNNRRHWDERRDRHDRDDRRRHHGHGHGYR